MTVGIVDSTVIIHILRNNLLAETWSTAQPNRLSVTPITWLEVIYGAPNKRAQASTHALLNRFDMVYLTQVDMDWAMQQLLTYRLSHGIAIMDCLIASVCHRMQVPLYTHNVRDMTILLGSSLVVKPY
ncbi:MAG: PIN domain-containing protein [Caldilineaceae bacterium]